MKRITRTAWSSLEGRYRVEDVAGVAGVDPEPPPGMRLVGYEWVHANGATTLLALGAHVAHVAEPPYDLRPVWTSTNERLAVVADHPSYRIETRKTAPRSRWEHISFTGASGLDLERITKHLRRERERAQSPSGGTAGWEFRLVKRRSVHLASEWKVMDV